MIPVARFPLIPLFIGGVILFCIPLTAPAQTGTAPSVLVSREISRAQRAVEKAEQRYTASKNRSDTLRASFAESQQKLNKQFQQELALGVSLESYPEVIRTLQTQRVELMIELAGLNAKRQLLTEAMATVEPKQKTDGSLRVALEKNLVQQREKYDHLKIQTKNGFATNDKLAKMQKEILEMELVLEKIQRETAKQPQALTAANAKSELLLELSLENAERKARLQKVEELLADFTKARPKLSQREQMMSTMELTQRRFSAAEFDQFKLQEGVQTALKYLERIQEISEKHDATEALRIIEEEKK